MSYKRPEVRRDGLIPLWQRHPIGMRIMALLLLPVWPVIFFPLWLWYTRDTGLELLKEVWDTTECIWAKLI